MVRPYCMAGAASILESEKMGMFSEGFGVALVALTYITLFTALIWRTATTLRASDEELLLSELRHRTLVEWSPEAISVYQDGTLSYVNSAAIRVFGAQSAQDLIGKPMLDLVHPASQHQMLAHMKSPLELGEVVPIFRTAQW